MATTTTLAIEEYLRTNYEPDADYVDGKLEERNQGKWEHSRIQLLIASWFHQNEQLWNVRAVTEQRMRVSPTRIRIPDIALLPPGRQPDVTADPPVLIVEIISPEDRYTNVVRKVREFLAWGVRAAWIIDPNSDPDKLTGETWTKADGGAPVEILTVAGTSIQLSLADLYQALKQS